MTVWTVLAKAPTGEAAKSGPWGLAMILILCAACYFLFKSMSKHMRRVREDFPVQHKKSRPVEQSGAQPPAPPQSPAQQGEVRQGEVMDRVDQARREPGEDEPPAAP
jgi:hypothetical protein